MAVNYVKLAATAKRLIEENGRTITLRKRNRTPTDSAKPWRGGDLTPSTSSEGDSFDVVGVVVPAGGSGFGRTVMRDGRLQQMFSEVALVAASSVSSGVDLEEFGEVADDGKNWNVVHVDTLQPADTKLVHVLGLVA